MEDPPDLSGLSVAEDFPLDRILAVLSDPLAVYTVSALSVGERVPLTDLADLVTGWVYADASQAAGPADRDRIRLLLYHVYLPKLDALDIVEFDAEAQTVVLREQSADFETILEWAQGLDAA